MTGEPGTLERGWYSGALWLWLLRPLEALFRFAAATRRGLYRSGLLATYQADKPLVVVGNITVGGTGKTPVVIALVEALQAKGMRVGVVSRGYGASDGAFPHTVTKKSTAAQCGDEPLLIHRRTGCPCVVDPTRPAAVQSLLQQFDVDIVLSDDGLQHYALGRDLEIAILDGERRTGNGFCLPAGPLREPVSRLKSVDFVLIRGGDDPADGVVYEPDCLVNIATGQQRPLGPLSPGEPVYALAGIGQPQQFFESLRRAGFDIQERVFADHHNYRSGDFADLADKPILMTEKDAVKCAEFAGQNAWYLRINARLPETLLEAVAALAQH